MAKILSDFPALPADDDPDRVRLYDGVYKDLAAQKLAVPATGHDVITRAELLTHLQGLIGARLKARLDAPIVKNPDKTADGTVIPGTARTQDMDLNDCIVGIPYAPNLFTAADKTEAGKG